MPLRLSATVALRELAMVLELWDIVLQYFHAQNFPGVAKKTPIVKEIRSPAGERGMFDDLPMHLVDGDGLGPGDYFLETWVLPQRVPLPAQP